jgi:hypothetical protein
MPLPDDHGPAARILDRHCPNLAPAERELAAERLRSLASVLGRIALRHALDIHRDDSTQSGPEGRIPSL